MSPPRCERWKGLLPVLVHCPVARGIVGDLKGLVEQRVGLHLPRVRVLVAEFGLFLSANQRNTVALSGMAGSRQIARKVSPSASRRQIYAANASV